MKAKPTAARRAAFLTCVLLASAGGAATGSPLYSVHSRVDWKARVLLVDIELDMAAAGLKMPEGRLQAQRKLDRDFPGLAKDAVFALQADSRRTVEGAVSDGSLEADRLVAIAGLARLESSSFSKDMRTFAASYGIGLDAVSSAFLSGSRPSAIRAPLEERPSRDYSGIIVYAKGALPVRGENLEGKAAPCLFPRIYDEEMRPLLDRSVVVPEVLSAAGPSGGILGYASALGVEAGERVGSDPMRVMAKELFGDARCDFVVSREDALRMLSSPANRELLRQGKVVVVLDLQPPPAP